MKSKKNLIQYGQALYTPIQSSIKNSPGVDPFETRESAYAFTKRRNFQGTKFKVNGLRYTTKNAMSTYLTTDKNEDFFKYT